MKPFEPWSARWSWRPTSARRTTTWGEPIRQSDAPQTPSGNSASQGSHKVIIDKRLDSRGTWAEILPSCGPMHHRVEFALASLVCFKGLAMANTPIDGTTAGRALVLCCFLAVTSLNPATVTILQAQEQM